MTRRDLINVGLRPMAVSDFAMVAGWLTDPEIQRWWDLAGTVDAVAHRYLDAIEGNEPTEYAVIELDGRPAGWAEWYRCAEHPDHHALVGRPLAVGIDYALAAGHRDLGVGPLVIDALATLALDGAPELSRVVSAPAILNERSWKALERAGFIRLGEIDQVDEGPSFLYERSRERSGLRTNLRRTFEWFETNSGWAPPPPETMADWLEEGVCRTPDDCWVDPDAACGHGLASWASVLRYADPLSKTS